MEIFSGGIWRYFHLPKRAGSTVFIPNSAQMRNKRVCRQAEHRVQLMQQEIIWELNPPEWPEGTWCCWKSQGLIQARLLDPHWALLLRDEVSKPALLWGCGRTPRWELSPTPGCAPSPHSCQGRIWLFQRCEICAMCLWCSAQPVEIVPEVFHILFMKSPAQDPRTQSAWRGFSVAEGGWNLGFALPLPLRKEPQGSQNTADVFENEAPHLPWCNPSSCGWRNSIKLRAAPSEIQIGWFVTNWNWVFSVGRDLQWSNWVFPCKSPLHKPLNMVS